MTHHTAFQKVKLQFGGHQSKESHSHCFFKFQLDLPKRNSKNITTIKFEVITVLKIKIHSTWKKIGAACSHSFMICDLPSLNWSKLIVDLLASLEILSESKIILIDWCLLKLNFFTCFEGGGTRVLVTAVTCMICVFVDLIHSQSQLWRNVHVPLNFWVWMKSYGATTEMRPLRLLKFRIVFIFWFLTLFSTVSRELRDKGIRDE